jgi:hypothetical protein
MKRIILSGMIIMLCICFALNFETNAQTIDITGPAGSEQFGNEIYALPNGNIVITDPLYDIPNGAANVGAVYLYNGANGTLISTLTGSTANDQIGAAVFSTGFLVARGITILPNGNFIVRSINWDNGSVQDVGAVTFVNGTTGLSGVVSPSNSLVGSYEGNRIGESFNGVTPLSNGNYLVVSFFRSGAAAENFGYAVTFGNGSTGVSGVISASNSLVGSTTDSIIDIRIQITELSNGNYVVNQPTWDNGAIEDAGAVTFGSGTTGISDVISSSNSLVGSTANDQVGGFSVTALTNGNYIVSSQLWDNGATPNAGAVTFGDGTTGITGFVSSSNSLVGSTANDAVGNAVTALTNGNYVIRSPGWDDGTISDVGAATFGNGTTGITGVVSSSNSLVGSTPSDRVSETGITALANGNYVVRSKFWNLDGTPGGFSFGAVTFGSGTTGITGVVSQSNSLIGSLERDRVGDTGVIALANGNYIVNSGSWDGSGNFNEEKGASTFGNGTTGISGVVSDSNSLVGQTAGDRIGGDPTDNRVPPVTILPNGNYLISSPLWDNGSIQNAGASTFVNGTTGITGFISPANSLVGQTANDKVGSYTTVLQNGNYILGIPDWDRGSIVDAGASTFVSGTNGITGVISISNSLVGSSAGDMIGGTFTGFQGPFPISLITELTNGNYVISTPLWDNGGITDAGAVMWVSGANGITGEISATNSLVGSTAGDQIGFNRNGGSGTVTTRVIALPNGDYAFGSPNFDNNGIVDAGAVTYGNGNGGTVGTLTESNSFIGTVVNGRIGDVYVYDSVNNRFVIRFPNNIVRIFFPGNPPITPTNALFDFDGDGRSDISVFRPDPNDIDNNYWKVLQSSNNQITNFEWGIAADANSLAPADYDGDGKTDFAIYRRSENNFYIYNSMDNSIRIENFGIAGDILTVADWDNDDKADISVYRQGSQSNFYFRGSNNNPNNDITFIPWGTSGDKPVNGDFDGDGKQDAAVFRPSNSVWYILQSSNGQVRYESFGLPTDKLIPADYDGDGRTDIAVFRDGVWYILQSSDGQIRYEYFGLGNDTLVPADYDGDGKTDVAVFRNGIWYINQSTSGFTAMQFGLTNDKAIPNAYINQ